MSLSNVTRKTWTCSLCRCVAVASACIFVPPRHVPSFQARQPCVKSDFAMNTKSVCPSITDTRTSLDIDFRTAPPKTSAVFIRIADHVWERFASMCRTQWCDEGCCVFVCCIGFDMYTAKCANIAMYQICASVNSYNTPHGKMLHDDCCPHLHSTTL